MNTRFLVLGTLVTAVALYAWQTVSNAALPWHTATMREFTNNDAVVNATRASAPRNGVYYSKQGIFAAVRFTPDLADQSSMKYMGPMLGRQAAIDLAAALLLTLIVLRLPAGPAPRAGVTLAATALAFGGIKELSDANWYGFSASYALVNTIDLTVQGLIAGLVLGALLNRMRRSDARADGAAAVRAEGGLPPGRVGEPARPR
jgi:hypothetical protein